MIAKSVMCLVGPGTDQESLRQCIEGVKALTSCTNDFVIYDQKGAEIKTRITFIPFVTNGCINCRLWFQMTDSDLFMCPSGTSRNTINLRAFSSTNTSSSFDTDYCRSSLSPCPIISQPLNTIVLDNQTGNWQHTTHRASYVELSNVQTDACFWPELSSLKLHCTSESVETSMEPFEPLKDADFPPVSISPNPGLHPTEQSNHPGASGKDSVVTLEVLKCLEGYPLPHAARAVGISSTAFKRACRRLGVRRWGYRRGPGRFTGRDSAAALHPSGDGSTAERSSSAAPRPASDGVFSEVADRAPEYASPQIWMALPRASFTPLRVQPESPPCPPPRSQSPADPQRGAVDIAPDSDEGRGGEQGWAAASAAFTGLGGTGWLSPEEACGSGVFGVSGCDPVAVTATPGEDDGLVLQMLSWGW